MALNFSFRCFFLLSVLWTTLPGVGLAGLGRWTSSGPDGATVLSLAVDPADSATVFAGTEAGGVFKTSDSGARWSSVGLGGLSVSAIVVNPTDGTKLYAAARSNVFKSTDGGISWRNASQGLPPPPATGPGFVSSTPAISALAIDPLVPSILYAGVTTTIYPGTFGDVIIKGGLFRSLDAGETWTATGLTDVGVSGIAADPTDSRILYAAVLVSGHFQTPYSLRRSVDGGLTWSVVRSNFPFATRITALAVGGRDTVIVLVALADVHGKGSVEKTTDGGQTWSPVAPLPDQLSVIALLIDPANASFLYAATADGVFKSSDGAATWSRVLNTPSRCLAVAPANSAVLYAGAGDGVSATSDAGASWTGTKAGLIATSVRELLVNPRSRNELYARSGLKIFHSADGGGNWQLIEELPSDLSPAGFALNWKNPSIQYVGTITMNGGLCTGVSRTLDGGRSWAPTSLTIGCILRITLDPQNPDTVYAVGQFGLWKSADSGGTWNTVLLQPIFSFAIAPTAPANLYAGIRSQGVLVSRDGGATWSSTGTGPSNVQSLAVDPENPARVYAGSAGALFKSIDGGDTWRETGQGLNGATALAIDPANPVNVYAGTAQGVFRSVDAGTTFTPFSAGLTNPSISALQIDASGRLLHAATQGGGVFDYAFLPDRLAVSPTPRPPAPRALKIRP